jgi:Flp pilus assembly pilin Flp
LARLRDAWDGAPDSARTNSGDHAQAGQGLIEYGLILMVMAVACVVSLVFFGDQLSSLLSLIASAV